MEATARRADQGGQAAVEWVGAVVAVALMVAALALWLPGAVRPPERPPDPVAAVAAPLTAGGRAAMPGAGADLARLVAGATPGGGGGRRAAAWLAGRARAGARLAADMGVAFGTSFAGRLRARLDGFLESPPPPASLLPDPRMLVPGAFVRDLVLWASRDPAALVDYVRGLRSMPAREAAVTAAGDAGAVAADAAVEAAEFLLKRLILRGVVRAGGHGGEGAP